MPTIKLITVIKADEFRVFDLARSIDLHKISTKHTSEEAVAGKITGLIELHESVTWRAKHFGVTQYLSSEITVMERPVYFVDEMRDGIFKCIKHAHRFETDNGVTRMIDDFYYESPLGLLGRLADWLFLKVYLTRLLKRRNATIKIFAESDLWKQVLNEEEIGR